MDSRKDPRAASAGSILVTRLMARGVEGVVTDGGFRDSSEIAELPFPAYHNRPSAPTNLTLNQALDINVPIGCGDVAVFPGDVMVGDGGIAALPPTQCPKSAPSFSTSAVKSVISPLTVRHSARQPLATVRETKPISSSSRSVNASAFWLISPISRRRALKRNGP
ncbi:Hypothetical protein NGAL_HAMBI2427_49910 [Neorhizobium galegae bv. orientalis]|uniref:Dimethylmenaquinone methyltransferase n=1 Tax=Neorhizobium galegae bv. orientalis str. HAMBI 540 TaxID=1028800 RepID=A0A068T1R7_NEOGA|nr:Hypothetical protein RG540_PA13200 [Neorhizobium galegae bv. orientalis str. HAMBI 540]CDZ53113.1 Hypothetical protein NGAL_HAMBI2427_49910 [Neorhizobium galegae bv. orientalis]